MGAETSGRRGWMVLVDGEIQGIGHITGLTDAMDRAERELFMLTGETAPTKGAVIDIAEERPSADSAV